MSRRDSKRVWSAAFAVSFALLASLFAQESNPAAVFLASTIDLGKVAPGSLANAESQVLVRVISDRPWQLMLLPDPFAGRDEAIALNVDGTNWTPLTPGLPLPLATGEATPLEGVVVTARVRPTPGFDAAPGRRQLTFSLMLNGQRSAAQLHVAYAIAPTVVFDEDNGRFAITADKPSERRDYDFSPRTYVVHSNAPWVLEIAPHDAAAADTQYAIEVPDVNGNYKPLKESITIAAGGPTGRVGVNVVVRLKLKLPEVAVAGVYSTNVDVRARIATALEKSAGLER